MADVFFLTQKYSVSELFAQYMQEIKELHYSGMLDSEKKKLSQYANAFKLIQNTSVMDLAKFALSFGRHTSVGVQNINRALPIVLGRAVSTPTQVDLDYARLLLDYAKGVGEHRDNIKDWIIRFIMTSKYSPVKKYIDNEMSRLQIETERNIIWYQQNT